MARMSLIGAFQIIPKGSHVFKITEVVYKEEFGKMEIRMETAKGLKYTERFSMKNSLGEPNQGALKRFSFFAKTALNDFGREEIDTEELVGRYIRCTVDHNVVESTVDPGKTITFVRLTDKAPADGFESETDNNTSYNLDDILK